jgi:glycosyltransferase involved in cell wall biosynthesis
VSGEHVSIVIPNRDNEPALDLVLARLAEHTTYTRVELVVVDDGSTDASRDILRRWRDSGRFERFVYEEREAAGAPATLNRALELASGEVVVQMDADASVATPGWVERMLGVLTGDERVGAVTPLVVYDTGFVQACGVELLGPEGYHDRGTRVLERPGRRAYHQRVVRFRPEAAPGATAPAEVDAGIGCCLMYRRADALAAGGYDTAYGPVWFDDLDLCVALRARELKVMFTPEVEVVHHRHLRATRRSLATGPGERARTALAALTDRALSENTRRRVGWRLGLDRPPRAHWQRLQHHYAYWREKWGWDMLNPDLDAVRRRWGGTEICWRSWPG